MKRVGKASGWLPLGGLVWCLALLTPSAWAGDAPADGALERAGVLLERMASALRSLNYEGTLVYSHENRLESLHLVHRIEQGRIQERLVSMSGPVRAVTRDRDQVMCVLPDGHPISVKRQGVSAGLLNTEGIDPAALGDFYRIEMPGGARVAGRDTEIVGIVPRDPLRYGYRFYLDQATALPLKSDLIDHDGESLEQLMFTSIDIAPIEQDVQILPAARGLRGAPATRIDGRWRFDDPPVGFQLVKHSTINQPSGAEVEHFLFTDRLSAYSIYIEEDAGDGLSGSTHIGAVHAAGRQVDGFQVTAVGEVPAETVERAVAGARRVGAGLP